MANIFSATVLLTSNEKDKRGYYKFIGATTANVTSTMTIDEVLETAMDELGVVPVEIQEVKITITKRDGL